MIVAIVPAAGKSARMGQPKLLLPLGNRRVIEHVLDALTQAPIDYSFVVLPPGADELSAVLQPYAKVQAVSLDTPTRDMRESVLAGVDHVESVMSRRLPDAFLVALADQPTISHHVVRGIVDRFQRDRPSIVVPMHCGKPGHPVLFSWAMIPKVRAIPPGFGLNQLISLSRQLVAECPVPGSAALCDLDTPEDYDRLQRAWEKLKELKE